MATETIETEIMATETMKTEPGTTCCAMIADSGTMQKKDMTTDFTEVGCEQGGGARPWTAAECARNVEGGTLCRGIFLTPNVEATLQTRETVVTVTDQLNFAETGKTATDGPLTLTFLSQQKMETFLMHMDKFDCDSDSLHLYGIVPMVTSRETEPDSGAGAVTFQKRVVANLELTRENMRLTPEALRELKEIEARVMERDYGRENIFAGFFKRFGSHVTSGLVELGGVWLATARASSGSSNAEKMEKLVRRVAEAAFQAGYSPDGRPSDFRQPDVVSSVTSGLSEDLLQSTRCELSRIGGPPDDQDDETWVRMLQKDPSLWRVVTHTSDPLPVWGLLTHHAEEFQEHASLMYAMEQEFVRLTTDPTEQSLQQNFQVEMWCQEFAVINDKNCSSCLDALQMLKKDWGEEDWRGMVLGDTRVQRTVREIADLIAGSHRGLDRPKLKFALEALLPWEQVSEQEFSGVQQIKLVIHRRRAEGDVQPLNVKVEQLPEVLRRKLDTMWEEGETVERLVRSLELRMRQMEETYEYLILVCVACRFGYSVLISRFRRNRTPTGDDLQNLASELEQRLQELRSTWLNKEKQLLVLKMAGDVQTTHYLVENLPGDADPELRAAWDRARGENPEPTLDEFRRQLHAIKTEPLQELVGELLKAFAPASPPTHRPFGQQTQEVSVDDTHRNVRRLLDILGLARHFQQKLTYEEVTTLTADLLEEQVGKTPEEMEEIPFYFIKSIISLDSETRENTPLDIMDTPHSSERNEEQDRRGSSSWWNWSSLLKSSLTARKEDDVISGVHPLDLIYLILLCADDFLRQELLDKLSCNQYAIPFLLPSPADGVRPVVLPWGLKAISRVQRPWRAATEDDAGCSDAPGILPQLWRRNIIEVKADQQVDQPGPRNLLA